MFQSTSILTSFPERFILLVTKEKNMITVEFKSEDKLVGMLMAENKVFKTGSRGFFGMSKISIGEKRYQVQVQMVEIGSKPKVDGEG